MSRVLNIAHRGARSLAPENTLVAARKALQAGADMWELDVSVTADGELVVLHDDSLVRTTNAKRCFPDRAPWRVTTFTLAEIKTLDAGSFYIETDPFGLIAAGDISKDAQAAMRGEPVPTLREALQFTKDNNWRVNVEIKKTAAPMKTYPVTAQTIGLIESLGLVDQVLLSSFEHGYLREAKAISPNLATAALASWSIGNPVELLKSLGCQTYHPYHRTITYKRIKKLRQTGYGVNVWTVNRRDEMTALIEAGATGIITDFPQILSDILDQPG